MKERPILFSGPMVRALLDGRKTQTRRIVKPQPSAILTCGIPWMIAGEIPCPYGQPGDRLWVREAWGTLPGWDMIKPSEIPIDLTGKTPAAEIYYRASHVDNLCPRWRPSIHMPRRASRITLEITDVRVELLTSISSADCIAEGMELTMRNDVPAKQRYAELWDSLNAKRGFPWQSNPWVWVVEFPKIKNG